MERKTVKAINRSGRAYALIGSDRVLRNCEVCWTCRFFNVDSKKCVTPPGSIDCPKCEGEIIIIKNYAWYRCGHWKERDE